MKSAIKRAIDEAVDLFGRSAFGRYVFGQVIRNAMSRTQVVEHHGRTFTFAVPDSLSRSRVDTFATKEPETLEWIDGMPEGSVLWDVGANVGLYSCYAASARGCRVFSFEPSVFNLELLARNILLTKLADRVTIVPLPLAEALGISTLNLTSTEWGGALSTFGQDYGHDGRALQKVFEFQTVGLSMADAVALLKIPAPDFVKIDVDGIEHLILRGGQEVLENVQGVLIEVNDEFMEQSSGCARYLTAAGLHLVGKSHSAMVEDSPFRCAFNQIWSRRPR